MQLLRTSLYCLRYRAHPRIAHASPQLNRARLSREVCERLNWRRAERRTQRHELPRGAAAHAGRRPDHLAAAAKSQARRLSVSIRTSSRRSSSRRASRPSNWLASASIWCAAKPTRCCGMRTSNAITISDINSCPGRSCATSCAPPATSSPPSASARAPGKSNPGTSSSVGRRAATTQPAPHRQ